jgi:hypothetical protein
LTWWLHDNTDNDPAKPQAACDNFVCAMTASCEIRTGTDCSMAMMRDFANLRGLGAALGDNIHLAAVPVANDGRRVIGRDSEFGAARRDHLLPYRSFPSLPSGS